jgi:hypothetical protein
MLAKINMMQKRLLIISLLFCLFLLPGCDMSYLQHQSNYANQKSVIIYPVVNRTKKDILHVEYYREQVFFSDASKSLYDKGYLIVDAREIQAAFVSPEDLTQLDNSQIPAVMANCGYDFSIVASLDDYRVTNLGSSREFAMTCYIYDTKASKLIWKKSISGSGWSGVIGGPMDALMKDTFSVSDDVLQRLGTDSISESPLFTRKEQ